MVKHKLLVHSAQSNYYRYKNAVTFAVTIAVTFDSAKGRRMP